MLLIKFSLSISGLIRASRLNYPPFEYVPTFPQRESEKISRSYVCDKCAKSYQAMTSLRRHKRLECGVVPAEVCPMCFRRFRHKFVLNSHLKACRKKQNN